MKVVWELASESATYCFLSSFHSCIKLIEEILPLEVLMNDKDVLDARAAWFNIGLDLPDVDALGIQKSWESKIFRLKSDTLLNTSTSCVDKARLLAAASNHSGDWLKCIPSSILGTLLDNDSFRIACALRLGADICLPHLCTCGERVQANGLHGLCCSKSSGRLSRHETTNDIIVRAFKSCGVPCIKEPSGCSRTDGRRPDGLTLVPWSHGKSLCWDFTCRDTFAPSYITHTSRVAGYAASLAEIQKHTLYKDLESRFDVKVIAIETGGTIGKEGLSLLNALGNRICEAKDDPRARSFLFQHLSISIQRGNAAAILGTLPAGKEIVDIFGT
jgi:hypothetical protein